jgi:nucleoside-diphosphate-sugar epimerase
MVNIHDVAACYVAVVEKRATGMLHAVDDTHETVEECARALSSRVEIRHTEGSTEFAEALMADQKISSAKTRERLGWMPKRNFLSSIDEQWREWRESLPAGP